METKRNAFCRNKTLGWFFNNNTKKFKIEWKKK